MDCRTSSINTEYLENSNNRSDGAQIPKATLFQAYSRWTDKHDIDGTNASWFGRKLSNVVDYEDNRARDGDDLVTVYTGIDLTSDGSEFLE